MKISSYNIYIIIIFFLIISGCNSSKNEELQSQTESFDFAIEVTKNQFESAGMKLGEIEERQIASTITTRGFIDVPPDRKVVIGVYHGGFVRNFDLVPGQKIKKGQLLFSLQNPEFIRMQQNYLEAKEQLGYLELDYKRQKVLSGENISSQKNFLKAESDYKVMLAQYNGLQEQLKLINVSIQKLEEGQIVNSVPIYATLDGYITDINTSLGAYLEPSNMAVEITNTDHLHLDLQIFEKDAMSVLVDQKIRFTVPELGDQIYFGEVNTVGKTVNSAERTMSLHAHISEEIEGNFIPGMFVEAEILIDTSTSWCLPETAVVEIDGDSFILIKEEEDDFKYVFKKEKVEIGQKYDQYVEIINSEKLSDKILLVNGTFNLIGG